MDNDIKARFKLMVSLAHMRVRTEYAEQLEYVVWASSFDKSFGLLAAKQIEAQKETDAYVLSRAK
jgi:hypothetical protein